MIGVLGTLLPKPNEPFYEKFSDVKQNKGSILQATVQYIKYIKRSLDESTQKSDDLAAKLQTVGQEKRRSLIKIQVHCLTPSICLQLILIH